MIIDTRAGSTAYLTVADAASALLVHPSTIRRWIDQGLLPAYRLGRKRIGVKRTDLEKLVESRPARRVSKDAQRRPLIVPRMTREEQQRGLKAIEEMERLGSELAAKYGKLEPESWALINESRDERSRQLSGGE